jgi:CheY-like chemotaxis protein
LRSDLRTFRPLLEPDWDAALRDELRWLGAELGAVRDTEVLLGLLREKANRLAPPERRTAERKAQQIAADYDIQIAEVFRKLLDELKEVTPAADAKSQTRDAIRVIVIDDEEGMREGMRRVLERRGFLVRTARDGETALQLLDEGPSDVALVDLKMPGIDGFKVTEHITRRTGGPTVVVIVSALATVEAAVEVTQHGAFDFLVVVQGKNMRDVAYFVAEKLAPLDHVVGTATHFVLKRYKVDGDIMVDRTETTRLPVTP